VWDFSKTPSVHPAGNEYLTFFRTVEGEGGKEEGCQTTLVTSLPLQVGSLTAASPCGY